MYKITIDSNSKNIPDSLYEELIDNEVYPSPKNDSTPCPWDADFSIEGNFFILQGGISSGGSFPSSTCTCKIELDDFGRLFDLVGYDFLPEDIVDELSSYGWIVSELI